MCHVMQGGLYVFLLFEYYASSGLPIMFFAILESICVGWIFGEQQKLIRRGGDSYAVNIVNFKVKYISQALYFGRDVHDLQVR